MSSPQGGVTYDICSLFLVTVPPFLAFYFGFLYLQTTLEDNNNIVDREKKSTWFDGLCWEECHFRIDSKVSGFNRRVESVILHLRSKEFQNQVNDFTEGRMRILLRLYWEKMRSVSNYRNGYHLQQSPDPANQFSVCRAEILLCTRILGGISSLFLRRRKTLDVCCLLQKIKFNKKRTMLLKRK